MASCAAGLKPALVMILSQTILAVVTICYKLAMHDGMRLPVMVAYRFIFGAAFIVPVAFFVERKKRPKLTFKVAMYGFGCGLFGGSMGQNLYLKSLELTSATFLSAMTNLIPTTTFVVAVCFRIEKLGWNTAAGKAKVLGTIVGIGGAMLLTFYKGPKLNIWNTNINLLEITTTHHHANGPTPNHHSHGDIILGAFLSLAACVSYSFFLICQAKAAETYPCPYSITAMMTVWASIQGVFFALCTERDHWSSWIMGLDIRLLTVFVSGTIGSGLMFTLVAWCVRMRGPVFVSVFSPLLLVIVAIVGSFVLEEKLHVGMLLGAVFIVGGLYCVLWGKGIELKKKEQLPVSKQVHVDVPLPPSSAPPPSGSGGDRKEADEEEREKE